MNGMAADCVVVTGATAGVGRAIALRFALAGSAVGLIARDATALAELVLEIEELGAKAHAVAADVADAQAVFAAADEIEAALGPIDIWINDAMVTVFSPIWEMTPEEFRRVTDVSYLGFVHGTMAALRHMRPREYGHIIQIGSALAYRGIPLQSAYCGAKHAIAGFTDSVRSELLAEGSHIAITTVHLPAVNTPQFDWARTHMDRQPRPVGPVFEPDTIAEHVFNAAWRPARDYWIGRSTIELILGNLVAPGIFDRWLGRTIKRQQTDVPALPSRRDNLVEPVTDLHRTRGSFTDEAGPVSVMAPGTVMRLAPIIAYGAALMAFGAYTERRRTRRAIRARLLAER